ncbi:MAG: hypothetical protein A2X11_04515 [Bacteroidetes bacterium GWE2_42_24]|nr:MAG: hypothetical protein A2X11_04515 [Bacteroidetes bacterium GWE2_42_24]OFY27675.1 MAG: hypothetical protein A2X09_10755 [Bacteroidetes bacterium GWF2_43_11]
MSIFLVLLFVIQSEESQGQQWTPLNPYPTSNILLGAWMMNSDTAIISGQYNTLLRTTDGGDSWFRCGSFQGDNMKRIAFATADTGFMIGSGKLFQTCDGGETWSDRGLLIQIELTDIFFLDNKHGWIVGNYNSVIRTTDGGVSWDVVSFSLMSNNMYEQVIFVSPDTGYLAGNHGWNDENPIIRRSTDGGLNWVDISIPSETRGISGMALEPNHTIWLGGRLPLSSPEGQITCISKSSDDGASWDVIELGPYLNNTGKIEIVAPGKIRVLCGNSLYLSDDHGTTWSYRYIDLEGFSVSVDIWSWADEYNAIAVGGNGSIAVTHDGGYSWSGKTKGINCAFKGISFTDDQHGVVAGFGNGAASLYFTADGGVSWTGGTTDSTNTFPWYFYDVAMSDQFNGWAVGPGFVFRTINGGADWQYVDVQISGYTLCVFESSNIWIGGASGHIAHSSDGGATWQYSYIGNPECTVSKLLFPDPLSGYAITDSETGQGFYKTTDGGLSWTAVPYPDLPFYIYSMDFVNADTGFLGVRNSGLVMTTDGGLSWSEPFQIGGFDPTYIRFFNELEGIVTTGEYMIAVTKNGGIDWTVIYDEPLQYGGQNFCFVSPDKGWAIGGNSLIMRFDSSPLGIVPGSEAMADVLQISPNPAIDMVTIHSRKKIDRLELFNISGIRLLSVPYCNGGELNLKPFADGVYLLRAFSGKELMVGRVVIRH